MHPRSGRQNASPIGIAYIAIDATVHKCQGRAGEPESATTLGFIALKHASLYVSGPL